MFEQFLQQNHSVGDKWNNSVSLRIISKLSEVSMKSLRECTNETFNSWQGVFNASICI